MSPLKDFLVAVSILTLSGCSANLDSECAELFEDLTTDLDHVLDAESFDDRVERLRQLEKYEEDIAILKKRAEQKLSQTNPSEQEMIWDDLNQRKTIALNGFNQRRFEIGNDVLEAAGHDDFFDEESFFYEAVKLSFACNNTLR